MAQLSTLEADFADRWCQFAPELPPETQYVIEAWRGWAAEKKDLGLTRRAVPYKADFAWPRALVLVEVQGATWVTGAHSTGAGLERDYAKSFTAQMAGWICFQLSGRMIRQQSGIWLPKIRRTIWNRMQALV